MTDAYLTLPATAGIWSQISPSLRESRRKAFAAEFWTSILLLGRSVLHGLR